jgi:hypothetical protein
MSVCTSTAGEGSAARECASWARSSSWQGLPMAVAYSISRVTSGDSDSAADRMIAAHPSISGRTTESKRFAVCRPSSKLDRDSATYELVREAGKVVTFAPVVAEVGLRHDAILAVLGNPSGARRLWSSESK